MDQKTLTLAVATATVVANLAFALLGITGTVSCTVTNGIEQSAAVILSQ